MEAPPVGKVPWVAYFGGRAVSVTARLWFEARDLAIKEFTRLGAEKVDWSNVRVHRAPVAG